MGGVGSRGTPVEADVGVESDTSVANFSYTAAIGNDLLPTKQIDGNPLNKGFDASSDLKRGYF
ncbi:hypothetical protein GT030_02905 [Streptomyces sp. SID1328]|uniref:hypothetical protein n=1 Tax=Streptomyces sp. SID1328 TaxID=2690250 RepID=UPI00136EEBDF|nr:hypothetical protein [Streptomyces sp. SID1328]MYV37841.1 hypothetical protein [Streptomyces sp. SID1328]